MELYNNISNQYSQLREEFINNLEDGFFDDKREIEYFSIIDKVSSYYDDNEIYSIEMLEYYIFYQGERLLYEGVLTEEEQLFCGDLIEKWNEQANESLVWRAILKLKRCQYGDENSQNELIKLLYDYVFDMPYFAIWAPNMGISKHVHRESQIEREVYDLFERYQIGLDNVDDAIDSYHRMIVIRNSLLREGR